MLREGGGSVRICNCSSCTGSSGNSECQVPNTSGTALKLHCSYGFPAASVGHMIQSNEN